MLPRNASLPDPFFPLPSFRFRRFLLPSPRFASPSADKQQSDPYFFFPRKEVIQPHLPIRLPCYDFTPVIRPALDGSLPFRGSATGFGHSRLPWCDGRCVQDPGTYSPRHSDPRLLAIPASCSRVAGCNPNWGAFSGVCSMSPFRLPL